MSADGQKPLVLVTVDCLRADHTGFMGYARPTTPFLDQLATESLVFPKAIVVGAPTYYSFPGIMASRFPLALGREVVGVAPGEPTLASVLQLAGYRTAAFVAANPYLSSRFGYDQGFEVFRDFLSEKLPRSAEGSESPVRRIRARLNRQMAKVANKVRPIGRLYNDLYFEYSQRVAASENESWDELRRFPAADVLVDQARDWLSSLGDEPFFLWLHLMDPHAPYYPPAEALRAMGAEHILPSRGRYLNAAWHRGDLDPEQLRKYRDEIVLLHDAGTRWVDMQLARLVEVLRRLSRWDSAAFVLTADHGEEFLDHGGRFHFPTRASQELLNVPLLLRVPDAKSVQLSEAPFSHLHLAPTVLDAIGIEAPREFEGRSYWPEVQARGGWNKAISESVGSCTNPMDAEKRMGGRVLAVQDSRHKLVLDLERDQEELFDLQSDPGELRPLAQGAETPARARLLRAALQHLQRGVGEGKRELALRARAREIGLEWSHSKMHRETLAS